MSDKKPRKPRRNYEKELSDLRLYVQVTMEAVAAYVPDGPNKEGQLEALKAVALRLEA